MERLGLLEPGSCNYVWLEEVVKANLDLLFPGLEIEAAYPFRITRDADLEIEEDEAADLLDAMREVVGRRHFGSAVRLEVDSRMPQRYREMLVENLPKFARLAQARRAEELQSPIQMCDALSRNMPEDLKVILGNCLSHGRRRFVEVAEVFRDLSLLKTTKDLSFGERKLYDTAQNLLVKELSIARSHSEEKIMEELQDIFSN